MIEYLVPLFRQFWTSNKSGADLNLAPSTLKVHVAALSNFLDMRLAEHTLIKRFFTAIGHKAKPKVTRFPSWDFPIALKSFCKLSFEPLEESSTRLLIALVSARRIGELQALSIAEPYCIILPDKIVLTLDPAFLPKVASDFHRSEEIIIPSFCNEPTHDKEVEFNKVEVRRCPIAYIECTKDWRSSSSLFVQFSGPNK